MKLQELAASRTTKQTEKVFESFFGQNISFVVGAEPAKAKSMLKKVRGLIAEERAKPSFHQSEQNPAYLKLVILEQALTARIREQAIGAIPGGNAAAAAEQGVIPTKPVAQMTPQEKQAADAQAKAAAAKVADPKLKQIVQKKANGGTLTPDEQTLAVNAAIETHESKNNSRLYNMLRESEIQQAQVIVSAKKMVTDVQKMLEQVTAMQFKDLPPLIENIRYQIGVEQAGSFNQEATSALSGLVESLQGAKQQLESALGVVSGQDMTIPGQEEANADLNAELPPSDGVDELPLPGEEEEEIDIEEPVSAPLGRERR